MIRVITSIVQVVMVVSAYVMVKAVIHDIKNGGLIGDIE